MEADQSEVVHQDVTRKRKATYHDDLDEEPLKYVSQQYAPALDEEDANVVKGNELQQDIGPCQKDSYGDDI